MHVTPEINNQVNTFKKGILSCEDGKNFPNLMKDIEIDYKLSEVNPN